MDAPHELISIIKSRLPKWGERFVFEWTTKHANISNKWNVPFRSGYEYPWNDVGFLGTNPEYDKLYPEWNSDKIAEELQIIFNDFETTYDKQVLDGYHTFDIKNNDIIISLFWCS